MARKLKHFGVTIPLDTDIMSDVILKALKNGYYEKQEAVEMDRIIVPGERILEVGGGIGFISTICAQNKNVEALRVYEANPKLIPFIKTVHEMNGVDGVELINGVLSNDVSAPTAKFYVRSSFWASSLSPKPFGYVEEVDVAVQSFSQAVESFRPTLIVCDIEGGELDLFENANLNGVKKVYMEIHQRVLGRRGIKRIFDTMSGRGFHYDQHHSGGSVVLFSHVDR